MKAYDKNIDKIYCPLSYGGNKVYAKNVCRTGERLFGAKFIALKEFMSADDYYRIIGNIDIAIFNHQRQEGLNNIYSLLSQAKTIYINSTITTWPFLIRKNIQVKDFLDIGNESLSKFDSRILENNRSKIRELVNIENTLGIWKKVFEV